MWQWAVMFSLLFALDFVYARWTQSIAGERPLPAAAWAALCYALTGAATVQYVSDPILLIPAVLGCSAGSYVAVRFRGL